MLVLPVKLDSTDEPIAGLEARDSKSELQIRIHSRTLRRGTVIPVTARSPGCAGNYGLTKHRDFLERLENPADMVRLTARFELS
jgi:hypothetical protein